MAVQAFPVSEESGLTLSASSSHEKYPVGNAKDGDGESFWVSNGERPNEGPSKDKPEWLLVDLGKNPTAKKVTIRPRPGYGPKDAEVQISEDGTTFTALKAFVMERDPAAEIHLPDKPARYIRLFVTSTYSPQSENVQVCEVLVDDTPLRRGGPLLALKALNDAVAGDAPTKDINGAVLMPLPPEEPGTAIDPAAVVDLSARCDADGILDWEVPAGKWKIVRMGVTLTGDTTSWSSPTGIGFEADPLDSAAIAFQYANVAAALIEDAGPLAGSVFRSVQIDSWELDQPNWTTGLTEGFKKCRGYDPLPYLPVLSGQIVGSADVSDRFLYDYRKTVGDLVAENYYGRLSALAEAVAVVPLPTRGYYLAELQGEYDDGITCQSSLPLAVVVAGPLPRGDGQRRQVRQSDHPGHWAVSVYHQDRGTQGSS